jgi:predicted metal-dependent hydrolase
LEPDRKNWRDDKPTLTGHDAPMIPFLSPRRKIPAPISAPASHIDVPHGEDVFRVVLKRSPTARRYTLRASSAKHEITLTMPVRGSLTQATDLAHRHGGWIAERLKKFDVRIICEPGAVIPLRGTPHRIEYRPNARGTVWTETSETGEALIIVAGRAEYTLRRIKDFLKKQAALDLDQAVKRYTTALGIPARRIALKDTTSRWGSCSSSGRLNFSWRLIFAPSEILDYLAAHEVAHLKELNHSSRFWRVVETLYPGYDKAEAWLKRHGPSLHRYQ